MQYAIDSLHKEREEIITALKSGRQERLKDLQEVDKALGWLTMLNENGIDKASRYDFGRLPFTDGYGWSNYRLMIDMEGDNPEHWIEYKKADGSHYQLLPDDILLTNKLK